MKIMKTLYNDEGEPYEVEADDYEIMYWKSSQVGFEYDKICKEYLYSTIKNSEYVDTAKMIVLQSDFRLGIYVHYLEYGGEPISDFILIERELQRGLKDFSYKLKVVNINTKEIVFDITRTDYEI